MRLTFFFCLLIPLLHGTAQAQECISHTDRADATYGTAEFIGEPWTHIWHVDQEWNNEAGVWDSVEPPIEHTLAVPGTAIRIRFEDDSTFTYGADLSEAALADNLSTIHVYGYGGEPGPYQAMRTADGAIFLLDTERCEPVSWDLAR